MEELWAALEAEKQRTAQLVAANAVLRDAQAYLVETNSAVTQRLTARVGELEEALQAAKLQAAPRECEVRLSLQEQECAALRGQLSDAHAVNATLLGQVSQLQDALAAAVTVAEEAARQPRPAEPPAATSPPPAPTSSLDVLPALEARSAVVSVADAVAQLEAPTPPRYGTPSQPPPTPPHGGQHEPPATPPLKPPTAQELQELRARAAALQREASAERAVRNYHDQRTAQDEPGPGHAQVRATAVVNDPTVLEAWRARVQETKDEADTWRAVAAQQRAQLEEQSRRLREAHYGSPVPATQPSQRASAVPAAAATAETGPARLGVGPALVFVSPPKALKEGGQEVAATEAAEGSRATPRRRVSAGPAVLQSPLLQSSDSEEDGLADLPPAPAMPPAPARAPAPLPIKRPLRAVAAPTVAPRSPVVLTAVAPAATGPVATEGEEEDEIAVPPPPPPPPPPPVPMTDAPQEAVEAEQGTDDDVPPPPPADDAAAAPVLAPRKLPLKLPVQAVAAAAPKKLPIKLPPPGAPAGVAPKKLPLKLPPPSSEGPRKLPLKLKVPPGAPAKLPLKKLPLPGAV